MGWTYKDTHRRSILKALTWRVCATVTTMLIVYLLTRELILALEAGVIEAVAKLLLYYIHERTWSAIGFGKKKHPLASLPVEGPIGDEGMEHIRNKLKELGYIGEE